MPFLPARRFLLILILFIAAPVGAYAQDRPGDGDWLGVLETPGGRLRLLVTVTTAEDGGQTAVLESLDQAPGQKIPVTTVTANGDNLAFEILTKVDVTFRKHL